MSLFSIMVLSYLFSVWVAYHMSCAHCLNFKDELAEMFDYAPEPLDASDRRFCKQMAIFGPIQMLVVLMREALVREHPFKRLWVW